MTILFFGGERESLVQASGSSYSENTDARWFRGAYARASCTVAGGDYYHVDFDTPQAILCVHFVAATWGFGSSGGEILTFRDTSGNAYLRLLSQNPTWNLQRWNGSAWVDIGSAIAPPHNTANVFDVTLDMSTPGAADVSAFFSGVVFATATIDLSAYASDIDSVRFGRGGYDGSSFSEVMIADIAIPINGGGLTTVPPTANGTDTGGIGVVGDVNEINMDLGTSIVLDAAGVKRSFVSTARTLSADRRIKGFGVSCRASKTGPTGPQQIRPYVIPAGTGTRYYGTTFPLTLSADMYQYLWALNPATGIGWTATEVNDATLEFGWEAVA